MRTFARHTAQIEFFRTLFDPIVSYVVAFGMVDTIIQKMATELEEGRDLDTDAKALEALAEGYLSASIANLSYFDAMIVKSDAEAAGVSVEVVENVLGEVGAAGEGTVDGRDHGCGLVRGWGRGGGVRIRRPSARRPCARSTWPP